MHRLVCRQSPRRERTSCRVLTRLYSRLSTPRLNASCESPEPLLSANRTNRQTRQSNMAPSTLTPEQLQAMLAAQLAMPHPVSGSDDQYQPKAQPYHVFEDGKWLAVTETKEPQSSAVSKTVTLLTWNIDFLVPHGDARMRAALAYLSSLVSNLPNDPLVIFFQEMTRSDLSLISSARWIQDRFYVTDLDTSNWISDGYGTTTLIDRRLCLASPPARGGSGDNSAASSSAVFRVPFPSRFQRDGLFADLALAAGTGAGTEGCVLRLCNVHLESLVANPPVRPAQMRVAGKWLAKDNVEAGLLAGDCNAIEPFDATIGPENGLRDTYLELGGKESDEDGMTWGVQVPDWMREKFGLSRMDRVFCKGKAKPISLERIGVGVKVEEEGEGQGEWVTDHFGLKAKVELVDVELLLNETAASGMKP
ncbi:Endonuclease/exonuclease/phosphatase [Lineolata rhizophorae]|uniref:Endonuclease/exonuclease/phosphatase n=1 Tax=Lineolata rhizophorae TaxID=578093 RepID=A0A6A6P4B8_9PEZI|nr:Endonuclease/exonuclease/phosphatase [Lineolata rhizophorae]